MMFRKWDCTCKILICMYNTTCLGFSILDIRKEWMDEAFLVYVRLLTGLTRYLTLLCCPATAWLSSCHAVSFMLNVDIECLLNIWQTWPVREWGPQCTDTEGGLLWSDCIRAFTHLNSLTNNWRRNPMKNRTANMREIAGIPDISKGSAHQIQNLL